MQRIGSMLHLVARHAASEFGGENIIKISSASLAARPSPTSNAIVEEMKRHDKAWVVIKQRHRGAAKPKRRESPIASAIAIISGRRQK